MPLSTYKKTLLRPVLPMASYGSHLPIGKTCLIFSTHA